MVAFNQQSSATTNIQLLPNGLLCWALFEFKEFRNSNSTGGRYASVILTVAAAQPHLEYQGKKIFTSIMDPDDERNSEGGRKMGHGALARLLEAAGVFDPAQPASYEQFGPNATMETLLDALNEKIVAIKVKVAKGKDGYADKNEVAEWLSPSSTSGGFAGWKKLYAGDNGLPKIPGAGAAAPKVVAPASFGTSAPMPTQAPAIAPKAAGLAPSNWLTQAQAARPPQ